MLRVLAASRVAAPRSLLSAPRVAWSSTGVASENQPGDAVEAAAEDTAGVEDAGKQRGGSGRARSLVDRYNRKLSAAMSARDFKTVFTLCQKMKDAGIRPTIETYNALIGTFAIAREADRAFDAFDELQQMGLKPSTFTLNQLIKASAAVGDVARARDVLDNWLPRYGVEANTLSYTHVMGALCDKGHLKEARALLAEMQEHSIQPNNITYAVLLRGALQHRNAELAYDVINQDGAVVSRAQLTAVLQLCIQRDQSAGALTILRQLAATGVCLDEGSLIGMMNMAARTASPELAETAWATMEAAGIKPLRPVAFHALLDAYARAGDIVKAFRTLAAAREAQIDMPRWSLGALVASISASAESVDQAYYVLEEMRKAGDAIDIHAANSVITSCPDLDRAFATFAALPELGLSANVDSYNGLLNVCVQQRQAPAAFRVVEEMRQAGLTPDAESYTQLIAACVRDGDVVRALSMLDEMREASLRPSAEAYVLLVRALARKRAHDRAMELVNEMREDGHFIHRSLVAFVETGGVPMHDAGHRRDSRHRRGSRPRRNVQGKHGDAGDVDDDAAAGDAEAAHADHANDRQEPQQPSQ